MENMKKKVRYSTYENSNLVLRDHLAIDRTVMANERTFLAYLRTAFSLLVVGLTIIKFVEDLQIVGQLLIPAGLLVIVVGVWRYKAIRDDLRRIPPA